MVTPPEPLARLIAARERHEAAYAAMEAKNTEVRAIECAQAFNALCAAGKAMGHTQEVGRDFPITVRDFALKAEVEWLRGQNADLLNRVALWEPPITTGSGQVTYPTRLQTTGEPLLTPSKETPNG